MSIGEGVSKVEEEGAIEEGDLILVKGSTRKVMGEELSAQNMKLIRATTSTCTISRRQSIGITLIRKKTRKLATMVEREPSSKGIEVRDKVGQDKANMD